MGQHQHLPAHHCPWHPSVSAGPAAVVPQMLELLHSDIKLCVRMLSLVWCVGWTRGLPAPPALHWLHGVQPGRSPHPTELGFSPTTPAVPPGPHTRGCIPRAPLAQLGPGSPGQDCGWERRISDPASGALPRCLQPLRGGKELHPASPAPPAPLLGWTQSRQHRPLGAPSKQYWDELAEYTAGSTTISAGSGLAPPVPLAGPPGRAATVLAASPALSRAAVASRLMQQMMHVARGSSWG